MSNKGKKRQVVGVKYIGGGRRLKRGLPPRDLTLDETKKYGDLDKFLKYKDVYEAQYQYIEPPEPIEDEVADELPAPVEDVTVDEELVEANNGTTE